MQSTLKALKSHFAEGATISISFLHQGGNLVSNTISQNLKSRNFKEELDLNKRAATSVPIIGAN